MGAFTWECPDYIPFEFWLNGAPYEPESNPNHRDLAMPTREPKREPAYNSMDGWLDKWRERECPRKGCSGYLDESYFCSLCGKVSLPKADAA